MKREINPIDMNNVNNICELHPEKEAIVVMKKCTYVHPIRELSFIDRMIILALNPTDNKFINIKVKKLM